MKKLLIIGIAAQLIVGCSMFRAKGTGAPVRDVPVAVASGNSLEQAVLSAAARRRWVPTKRSDSVYRLRIDQRGNVCVVDVVMNGNSSYSILPVESNIPVRKYDQWVNNLRREINMRAQRAR